MRLKASQLPRGLELEPNNLDSSRVGSGLPWSSRYRLMRWDPGPREEAPWSSRSSAESSLSSWGMDETLKEMWILWMSSGEDLFSSWAREGPLDSTTGGENH